MFGISQNVVILLAYVTGPGKVTNAYKQTYGMDLFLLFLASLSDYVIATSIFFYLVTLTLTQLMPLDGMAATLSGLTQWISIFKEKVLACTRLSTGMGESYLGCVKLASSAY